MKKKMTNFGKIIMIKITYDDDNDDDNTVNEYYKYHYYGNDDYVNYVTDINKNNVRKINFMFMD